ncbi:hypothetical protein [Chitinophaga barathri]|uniref:Uncharacterized protein n=1 Tax=Chitinophaga barathri TaxID=1647451 RepID=A0A3N4MBA6_9BACT|nr:hypothetical protein [Chitinophaga barathri]RPD41114.1 hypothetical protein EG028_10535 [Chitinophaga barathri]
MKNLKLSFAFLIAVLAVGVTVITKAGSRDVTHCFINITVTDGTNPAVSLAQVDNCSIATTAFSQGKIFLTAATTASSQPDQLTCPPSTVKYCCVKIAELAVGDPGYSSASFLNLGSGLRKYKVTQVFCKP